MTPTERPMIADPDSRHANGPLVLVVEDNERNARLLVAMLESAGYRTRSAMDGTEGLRLACELLPELVITDLQMPGLDGLELTRALKARAETALTPVIAVTAHALSEHRQEALAAGCRSFLAKPVRFRSLLAEVADAIASRRTTA